MRTLVYTEFLSILVLTCLLAMSGTIEASDEAVSIRLETLKAQTSSLRGNPSYSDKFVLVHESERPTRNGEYSQLMDEEEVYDEDVVFEILDYVQKMHEDNPDVMVGERLEFLDETLTELGSVFEQIERSNAVRSSGTAAIDKDMQSEMVLDVLNTLIEDILMPAKDYQMELSRVQGSNNNRSPEAGNVRQLGKVNAPSGANVRSGPSTNYRVIKAASHGEEVTVLEKSGNWYYIRLKEGKNGYIHKSLLTICEDSETPDYQDVSVSATVKVNAANVRRGPGTSYAVVDTIKFGTSIKIIGQQGNWYKIQLPDRREGFIYSTLVFVDESDNESRRGRCTASGANVRVRPSLSARRITAIQRGDIVVILGRVGNWYHIRMTDGRTGYCHVNLIEIVNSNGSDNDNSNSTDNSDNQGNADNSDSSEPADDTVKAYVNVSGVNVRSGPSTNHRILTSLQRGVEVEVLEDKNSWSHVVIPGGRKGYIYSTLLATEEQNVSGITEASSRITASALGAVGKRGVIYGQNCYTSATANGRLACAAVVSSILRHADVGYERQILYCPYMQNYLRDQGWNLISNRQYQPGDVCFWTRRSGDRARHVGVIVQRDVYGNWWAVDNSSSRLRVLKRPLIRSYYPVVLPVRRVNQ